ncbi:hypothetical protein Tco_0908156 [Tanacetum coccineum]|uniref:Gag/pol protein n=1 Tax=Tanacetum coccineum TaxID=301880 RepID=A0ABQ5CLC6_9ASTR
MKNSKKRNLPLHHGKKTNKDLCPKTDEELDRMSRVPYALAIGSIMYAMMCTRPDVSFSLSMVSRYQQNPGEGYWTAVKNILNYLRNTKGRFLVYGGEEHLRVTGYCDASWQTDKDDSHSQFGWVFLLNGISNDLCPKIDEELDRMSRVPYASVVGSIMYAMTCTRPDVSFALSMVRSPSVDPAKSSAVALDGTLCLVNQDRLRPIIVDDLSKWETVGFSVQVHN